MKKILSALMICVILASSLAPCTLADGSELSNEEPLIEPRYEVIYTISTTLNISDSGRAECYASVRIPSGYEVDLLAELQQKNGNRWEQSMIGKIQAVNVYQSQVRGMLCLDIRIDSKSRQLLMTLLAPLLKHRLNTQLL